MVCNGLGVGKNQPGLSAQRKEQVSFKIFHTKRIYFSFELQTINTNPKLTRISNIHLRSVGSNRKLFTKWKSRTATASNWISILVITNSPYTMLRIFTLMAARCPYMLGLVKKLAGRTLESLRGLKRGLGYIKCWDCALKPISLLTTLYKMGFYLNCLQLGLLGINTRCQGTAEKTSVV